MGLHGRLANLQFVGDLLVQQALAQHLQHAQLLGCQRAKALDEFEGFNRANLAKDRDGDLVFMAKSPWDVNYQQEKNPELIFSATKER